MRYGIPRNDAPVATIGWGLPSKLSSFEQLMADREAERYIGVRTWHWQNERRILRLKKRLGADLSEKAQAFLDTIPKHRNPDTVGPPYERDIAFLTLMVAMKCKSTPAEEL